MERHVKYPRTLHLPWSHPTSDDKILKTDEQFIGKEVVVTLKMDGENTTMYEDFFHARSLDSNNHYTRNWAKGLWGSIKHKLGFIRVCGENLWAQHTIKYDDLNSYFYVFSMWNNVTNECYDWEYTKNLCKTFDLHTVPVLYIGVYDKEKIIELFNKYSHHEGYVVRLAESFHYDDFSENVAKYVRPKFQEELEANNKHWLYDKIEQNKLK